MHCWNDFEAIRRPDVPLSGLTWYKLGGPARSLYEPRDEHELAGLIRRCNDAGAKWRVLGGGANLLVRDHGVDDVTIRLTGPVFQAVRMPGSRNRLISSPNEQSRPIASPSKPRPPVAGRSEPSRPVSGRSMVGNGALATVEAGAGVDMLELVKRASLEGWEGFEALAGIPGTVGGCIRMNAGGRFGSIASLVKDVTLVTCDGEVVLRDASELSFSYRRTDLADGVVVSARFHARPAAAQNTHRRYLEIWRDKYRTQPPLKARSSGCVFKNPRDASAGRLIDEAGLKGTRRGGAEISAIHANFIVAHNGARAADVMELIDLARERVWALNGIEMELEVEVW